jgi:hypothetical protein
MKGKTIELQKKRENKKNGMQDGIKVKETIEMQEKKKEKTRKIKWKIEQTIEKNGRTKRKK